jgi:2-oxoglutarate dehydrogenase E1 component
MLLPHGHEGMGPEHSSARPERFLQGCGNLNIQFCSPTTPAQYFHLLRRQALRFFQKPLIIMSPKSLLRHPKVVSKTTDYTKSSFKEVLEDPKVKDPLAIETLIFCCGKIYYDLLEVQESQGKEKDTAVLRIEQLYPFPVEALQDIFSKYKNIKEIKWVQEEPKNMGCYNFILPRFQEAMPKKIKFGYVGRKHSGSTAEGSGKAHKIEQQRIVEEAFSLACSWEPRRK